MTDDVIKIKRENNIKIIKMRYKIIKKLHIYNYAYYITVT